MAGSRTLYLLFLVCAFLGFLGFSFILKPYIIQSSHYQYLLRDQDIVNDKWEWLPAFPYKVLIVKQIPIDLKIFQTAEDIQISHNDQNIYILTYTTLYKLNVNTLTVERLYGSDYKRGEGYLSIAISPDDTSIILYKMPNLISHLNAQDFHLINNIKIPESDYKTKLLFHPSGKQAYALTDRGNVLLVDLESRGISKNINLEESPSDFALSQDGKYIYITYKATNYITVFETSTHRLIDRITIEEHKSKGIASGSFFFIVGLNAMAIDSSNQLLYIQAVGDFKPKSAGGDMIYIVDIRKRSVEKKIKVGLGAARPQFAISGKYLFSGDKGYKEGKGFTTVVDHRTLAARYHLVFPKKVNDYVINQKSNKLYAISYEPRPPTLTVLQLLEPDDQ